MKKLSSSPSSSFSSSTTTITCVDGTDVHTPKSSALACISGMVRRLLCRNSLPTYPCDQLKLHNHLIQGSSDDVERDYLNKRNDQDYKSSSATAPAGPGLVARLMGLESLPQATADAGLGHDRKCSPDSISRSRSLNSVDALKGIASIQGKNRRVKSFRENPTFVEDEEFLILSFENEEKNTKTKQNKVEAGRRKKSNRQRNIYNDKNKENQEPDSNASNENSIGKIPNNESTLKGSTNIHPYCGKEPENSLPRIRMEKSVKCTSEIEIDENEMNVKRSTEKTRDNGECFLGKKIEAECDSSPNSVLDATFFPCDSSSQITHSGEHSKTRRRTLAEELQNYRKLNFTDTKHIEKTETEKNRGDVKFRDQNKPMFVKICRDIRTLVEKEAATESVWRYDYKGIRNLKDWKEEIIGEMEMQILDEIVDELCR